MTDPAVGKEQHVNVHIAPFPGGARLIFMTTDGKYVGSIQFDTASKESLGVMGNLFQQFAASQSSGIQIANGMPAGLRTS